MSDDTITATAMDFKNMDSGDSFDTVQFANGISPTPEDLQRIRGVEKIGLNTNGGNDNLILDKTLVRETTRVDSVKTAFYIEQTENNSIVLKDFY